MLMPVIISIVITFIQFYGVIWIDFPYKERVISASAIIMLAWIVLFLMTGNAIRLPGKLK